MKIKTTTKLTNLKGEHLTTPKQNGKGKDNVTLGLFLTNIVLEPHKDKPGFRPLEAYKLAQKFDTQEEVEVTASEFIQIKELIENNESYLPLVLGQALELLNSSEQ